MASLLWSCTRSAGVPILVMLSSCLRSWCWSSLRLVGGLCFSRVRVIMGLWACCGSAGVLYSCHVWNLPGVCPVLRCWFLFLQCVSLCPWSSVLWARFWRLWEFAGALHDGQFWGSARRCYAGHLKVLSEFFVLVGMRRS